jgi:predicted GH43/DUF377 family glycosyl hydrolase
MSALMQKQKSNELFSRKDLLFLYEINAPIEGFGYEDPRIVELRGARNPEEDLFVIFDVFKDKYTSKPQNISNEPNFHYSYFPF